MIMMAFTMTVFGMMSLFYDWQLSQAKEMREMENIDPLVHHWQRTSTMNCDSC